MDSESCSPSNESSAAAPGPGPSPLQVLAAMHDASPRSPDKTQAAPQCLSVHETEV